MGPGRLVSPPVKQAGPKSRCGGGSHPCHLLSALQSKVECPPRHWRPAPSCVALARS